jgi:hypothetical protein
MLNLAAFARLFLNPHKYKYYSRFGAFFWFLRPSYQSRFFAHIRSKRIGEFMSIVRQFHLLLVLVVLNSIDLGCFEKLAFWC